MVEWIELTLMAKEQMVCERCKKLVFQIRSDKLGTVTDHSVYLKIGCEGDVLQVCCKECREESEVE